MNGGYSIALSKEKTIFVFASKMNIQIYSRVLALKVFYLGYK